MSRSFTYRKPYQMQLLYSCTAVDNALTEKERREVALLKSD